MKKIILFEAPSYMDPRMREDDKEERAPGHPRHSRANGNPPFRGPSYMDPRPAQAALSCCSIHLVREDDKEERAPGHLRHSRANGNPPFP